jgi:2-succinyl-5-enolpyruvyl-6-hydroxy-3-cyclohexene-1-carboxylate synthase
MLWAGVIAEALARLGVRHAVIAPGSRSAPLTLAFSLNKQIETFPVLDERSAAFFALGMARVTGKPTVLICTSGTAVANFHPAIMEASASGAPLLVLTADRPPEAHHCHDRQTTDQLNVYGSAPRWQKQLPIPEPDEALFRALRQTIVHAWEKALWPKPGPVHLNIPFREPLAPSSEPGIEELREYIAAETFFDTLGPMHCPQVTLDACALDSIVESMSAHERGLIVVSQYQGTDCEHFVASVGMLSKKLGWPIIADFLSPLRGFADHLPGVITRYDTILRNDQWAEVLEPRAVLNIGAMPISKILRSWLENVACHTWVLDPTGDNYDPLHRAAIPVRCSVQALAHKVDNCLSVRDYSGYWREWLRLEEAVESGVAASLEVCAFPFEGAVVRRALEALPEGTPVFIASSMPVRDAEFFGPAGVHRLHPYFNRGVDGIDGTLSTAMGVAQASGRPAALIVGDLALLHDLSGFLLKNRLHGSLTVLVINNNGGRIFENLPLAECRGIPFEDYFITPQHIDIQEVAKSFGWEAHRPASLEAMESLLETLPNLGVRLVEIHTDSARDVPFRKKIFKTLASKL